MSALKLYPRIRLPKKIFPDYPDQLNSSVRYGVPTVEMVDTDGNLVGVLSPVQSAEIVMSGSYVITRVDMAAEILTDE